MEDHRADRLEGDALALAELVVQLGASDVYVLPNGPAEQILDARGKGFWVAKQNGTDDIIDVVVPRFSMPLYRREVGGLAAKHGTRIGRVGHAGDGNVHVSVLQKDEAVRKAFPREVFAASIAMGGVVSAEHGIGTEKVGAFLELEDPVKLTLVGILHPGVLFGT